MIREAVCHCGALRLRCEGQPKKISLCHCRECQRRTGSLFSIAAFYDRASVAIMQGQSRSFRRSSASGSDVTFHFCPHCGSNLWWEPDRMPELVGIAVGGFADPDFPAPEQAVWAEAEHAWLGLMEKLPTHARNPVP